MYITIIKADVTECNDNMVDVSNQSDCIIKNPHSEMKSMQEKERWV